MVWNTDQNVIESLKVENLSNKIIFVLSVLVKKNLLSPEL